MQTFTRILVVDDERDTCTNLHDILSDLGYDVDVAYDGETALQLVRRTPYDIALLDLKMPGMSGLELYREIKQLRAGTVAVIVTAYATGETAAEAMQAGAYQVLSKPIETASLLQTLEEVLQQPAVLVVDDDRELCANLWDTLRERGYRTSLAHSLQEASRSITTHAYDLVLIDMVLPGGDGCDVYREVRLHAPEARTILITGHRLESSAAVDEARRAGADAICYKPFDVAQLIGLIRNLCPGS